VSLRSTRAYADRLAADRRQWSRPLFVAEKVRVAIENPVLFGEHLRPRDMLAAMPWRKTAERVLGPVLLHAATAPAGQGCRWCLARRFSRVKGLPPVELTAASRLLLGPECTHYATAAAAARKAYIHSLITEQRARSRNRAMMTAIVASAEMVGRDRFGRPTRLRGRGDARPPVPEAPRLAMGPACGCSTEVHDVLDHEYVGARTVDAWLGPDHRWSFRRVS